MKRCLALASVFALVALPALAELKKPELIDCNAKKAARNAAMEATVGVHGGCDAEKLAGDTADDAKDKVKDARDGAGDRLDDAKDKHGKLRDKK